MSMAPISYASTSRFRPLLLRGDRASRLIALVLQLAGSSALLAPSPFLEQAGRILKQRGDGLPDVVVELLDAHRCVAADARSAEVAVRVPTDAVVVPMRLGPCCGVRGSAGARERVAAERADRKPLQQVALASCVALRQPLVARELGLRRLKQLGRDERGHVDPDPLVGRGALARLGRLAATASRTQKPRLAGGFALAVCGPAHVRGVAKDRPDRGSAPTRGSSARGDLARRSARVRCR